jgi:hypothetical protein
LKPIDKETFMTKLGSITLSLAVCVGVATAAGQAQAIQTRTSPFGSSAVTAVIGNSGGIPTIAWSRNSDGTCDFTTDIGDIAGLVDDFQVHGSSSADSLHIAAGDQMFCGILIGALAYDGHFLDLVGQLGNDQLISFNGGDTWIYGNGGDDTVVSFNPGGYAEGNDGHDIVFNLSAGSSNTLLGGPGDDCLHDQNGAAMFFNCEAGAFDAQSRPVPAGARNCEFTVDAC